MARDRSSTAAEPGSKPRSDAYTGILLISLIAQIAGAVFLYLDWSQYDDKKPPAPTVQAKGSPAPGGKQPPPPGGGQQGMPGGQMGMPGGQMGMMGMPGGGGIAK